VLCIIRVECCALAVHWRFRRGPRLVQNPGSCRCCAANSGLELGPGESPLDATQVAGRAMSVFHPATQGQQAGTLFTDYTYLEFDISPRLSALLPTE
jgi:hypothetical protein